MEGDTAQEMSVESCLEEVVCAEGDTIEELQLWVTHTRAVTAMTDCSQANPHLNRSTPEGPQSWVIHPQGCP